MQTLWDEHRALSMLKKWINDGKWESTTHFRKHNSSLYEYLYRTMGLNAAFDKIGLHYSDFKRSRGKKQKEKDIEKVIQELDTLIKEDKWNGIRDLQLNNSLLYRELSRIGFNEAFDRLKLDYKKFRYAIWSQESIKNELKRIIDKGEWRGTLHLKRYNNRLYNAIVREMGFSKTFLEIGLDYDDYKK